MRRGSVGRLAARFNALPGPIRGAVWAVISMVVFSVVPVSVKYLSDTMTSSQIVFMRSIIGLAIMAGYFWWRGFHHLRTRHTRLYLTRSFINFVGMVFWFYALGRMAFADAVAIHFTLPLFTVVMAVIFLRERVGIHRTSATVIGFLGVLVILRPGMATIDLAAVGVLASAALYAGTVIIIKFVLRTDSAATINFYSNLYMMMFAAIPTFFDWAPPTWEDVPALILLGLAGVVAPWLVTRALEAADASVIAPFDFLRLPFSALMGYLFFAQTAPVWTWIGAAIIFCSTYYITLREGRAARRRSGLVGEGQPPAAGEPAQQNPVADADRGDDAEGRHRPD